MDAILFKQKMIANNDTQQKLADAMGLEQSAISNRINGKVDFRQSEINFIINRYHLTDSETRAIFFPNVVS